MKLCAAARFCGLKVKVIDFSMRFKASCIVKKNFFGRKGFKLFSNYLTAIEDDDSHERALTASSMVTLKNIFLIIFEL